MILKFRINIRELLTLYDEIVALKQDKETGVVILDNKIYVEIYLSILGYHFMKLDKNRTSSHESKIHRTLRKIKPLRHIYPTLTQHHVNLLNTLPNYFHH